MAHGLAHEPVRCGFEPGSLVRNGPQKVIGSLSTSEKFIEEHAIGIRMCPEILDTLGIGISYHHFESVRSFRISDRTPEESIVRSCSLSTLVGWNQSRFVGQLRRLDVDLLSTTAKATNLLPRVILLFFLNVCYVHEVQYRILSTFTNVTTHSTLFVALRGTRHQTTRSQHTFPLPRVWAACPCAPCLDQLLQFL